MKYLRIVSVAAGLLALCASSLPAQTITANFTGIGSYDKIFQNFIDGRVTYGWALLEFSDPVFSGVDLATKYDWEVTGSVSVRVDTAGIGNQDLINLGTFNIDLPAILVNDVSAIDAFLMTWGSADPLDLNGFGVDAHLEFGAPWVVTAHLFEQDFHLRAFSHYGFPPMDLRYAQFTFLDGVLTATAVPEPATIGAIAIFSLMGAIAVRRRFRKSS